MGGEQRYATEFREAASSEPGLVLQDDGSVQVVKPDGTRASIGGSQPSFDSLVGARATTILSSYLYELGAVPKPIGPTGFALTGLAYDPVGKVLYGATSGNSGASPRSLVSIDPKTGAATLIGALGAAVSDITCDAAGSLYGTKVVSSTYSRLVSISKSNGSLTVIGGAPSQSLSAASLSFHPDGTLYLFSQLATDSYTVHGYVVDPATGAVTDIFGSPFIFSLEAGGSLGDVPAAATFAPDGTLWLVGLPGQGKPVKLYVSEAFQDVSGPNEVLDSRAAIGYDRANGLDAVAWLPAEAFA